MTNNDATRPGMKIIKSIANGPSRDRIFDSMKYLEGGRSPLRVAFEVSTFSGIGTPISIQGEEELCVTICAIEHEDGSGNSFNLRGTIISGGHKSGHEFRAYYNTRSRKGKMVIDSNK